jgi:hypothetical protein
VRGYAAPLRLAAARVRRRPGRWVLPALGIALAAAFAGGVAAEGQIAADHAARAALAGVAPADRAVRLTWNGTFTPAIDRQARALMSGFGLSVKTEAVLLQPVRLGGLVVHPAAVAPLDRWVTPAVARRLGPCRPSDCPMLLAGPGHVPSELRTYGVRIRVVGSVPLSSAVPLGFSPNGAGEPSVLLTGDVDGLERLPGLHGVFRTHTWLNPLVTSRLHSWQLAPLERRLARSQAAFQAVNSSFSLTAPFAALDAARSQARAAPQRLLLAGGGAVAVLALFVLLAGGGLRRDQLRELARLETAGARRDQAWLFSAAEAGWLSGVALGLGAGLAVVAGEVLARAGGEPAGAVLGQSLVTPAAVLALTGAWLIATTMITLSTLARSGRLVDVLAVAAVAALVTGLALDAGSGTDLAPLLAPLCCLAAGVLAFRVAATLLRAGERVARRGPVVVRLALVGLARSPAFPSLAIAFVAVAIGLGGFALAYRATLTRSAADQAANRVPLDALVAPSPEFETPLDAQSLARWRALAGGPVLPVRRTSASYLSGAASSTVTALGVPAAGLPLIYGWRSGDASASLATLARRLAPAGPVRRAGPAIPSDTQWLSATVVSPALDVAVTADLRDGGGDVRRLELGTASPSRRTLRARLPAGRWELEAVELNESAGLEATNGHQNGENPAAATQFRARVRLGPVTAVTAAGARRLPVTRLAGWRGVGAATITGGGSMATVDFSTTGTPGILRPVQPGDAHALPVLTDPGTSAAAGPGGTLGLTVDGLPVRARVVGTVRRFPTIPGGAAGFIVADEATLAAALDAELPGQGRADELWIATSHLERLRAALRSGALAPLGASFRADIERGLRAAPIARGVLGTLTAAAVLSAALAMLGLLTALLGGARDERIERDLEAQGLGPRALRADLRLRLAIAAVLGVGFGLVIAVLLTRLAVASVRAAATAAAPEPPLVTVVPWWQLLAWGVAALAVLLLASWLATWVTVGRQARPRHAPRRLVRDDAAVGEGASR